jgi:hypothetical protein
MLTQEDKTPSIVTFAPGVARPPRLTPLPARTPPPGRPQGALAISEMVERITKEVTQLSRAELTRANAELRAEVAVQTRLAIGLGTAALAMNTLVVIAVVAFAHRSPVWLVAVGMGGVALFAAGIWAGRRRAVWVGLASRA